jgi:hypothetical protein
VIDPGNINHAEDPIMKMMREGSGLWDITDERVGIIRGSVSRLSDSGKKYALEMLSIAGGEQCVWVCKVEYYSVLREIQEGIKAPTRDDVLIAIANLERSSEEDRVSHREWVSDTILILKRLADAI